jgi:hypothetical protein
MTVMFSYIFVLYKYLNLHVFLCLQMQTYGQMDYFAFDLPANPIGFGYDVSFEKLIINICIWAADNSLQSIDHNQLHP